MIIPLISQHTSWISIDPIQGCKGNCAYCYLLPLKLANTQPEIICQQPEIIYNKLIKYQFFNKNIFKTSSALTYKNIPIAIGNYTDICMGKTSQEFLLNVLHIHKKMLRDVPICIPTKSILDVYFLEKLNELNIKIIFLISISFLPEVFEKKVPLFIERLKNIKFISQFPNIKVIHWWRPILSIKEKSILSIEQQIDLLQEHGSKCSIIIGLAYGRKLKKIFQNKKSPLHNYFNKMNRSEYLIFDTEIRDEILKVSKDKNYIVFSKTSCALSYILKTYCYNAGFRKIHHKNCCHVSLCPNDQIERCLTFRQRLETPTSCLMKEVAGFINVPIENIFYNSEFEVIIVKGMLSQEQQNYLTQATSFPVLSTELKSEFEWSENWRIKYLNT